MRATPAAEVSAPPPPSLPNDATIRLLLAIGLYDEAIGELRYAQRTAAASPAVDATIAWAYHQKGELRRAITLMRRAYPQFLSTSGQQLPAEIRQVIFPLTYWPSIQREAKARGLDPYMIAALIAQESTFDPQAPVRRQRLRPDAGAAGHGPPHRAADRHPPVPDVDAHGSRDQPEAGDRPTSRGW